MWGPIPGHCKDAALLAVERRHFRHFALDANGRPAGLSFVLKRADVVFHSLEDISAQTRRYLMPSCERLEKPLIPLAESSLAGLRDALGTCCPLA
jgi:hypothetical protein